MKRTATSPPIIRQLPDQIANQIAAGEVIERPAAVVKELAENALDAGATRIVIRLDDGGRRLIEVEDNGHGMRPDDLRLAVSRHATSKLVDADDLFRIASLGFRGEALPSIAGVSDLSLASRFHDAKQGHQLKLSGGSETDYSACAMSIGTRVSVHNLFWNVPARLKFLKSEAAETGHATDQVMRLALSHPAVAFRLECNGRTAIDLPADETLQDRIRALFGAALADRLLVVDKQADTMAISGFIAHPQEAKATTKRQFVFLNGRFVKDRLLLAAVREGFKGFLEPRLHGTVFLHLDVDPSQVDVNVHPTKSEVRFRREGEIFALVRNALQMSLTEHAGGFRLLPTESSTTDRSTTIQRTIIKPAAPPAVVVQERYLPPSPINVTPHRVAESASPAFASPTTPSRTVPSASEAVHKTSDAPTPTKPTIRRVLQLHRMYLLIETDRGIRLVDQHALHEKALLHLLDPRQVDLRSNGIQTLAIPLTVTVLPHEATLLAPLLPALQELGISAAITDERTVAIAAYPALLRRAPWAQILSDLVAGGDVNAVGDALRERLAHSAACRAAVKAGQVLGEDELRELASLLDRFDDTAHCPHGRPTTLDLSWDELERRFQR